MSKEPIELNDSDIVEEYDRMSKEDSRRYLILKDPNIYKGLIWLAYL